MSLYLDNEFHSSASPWRRRKPGNSPHVLDQKKGAPASLNRARLLGVRPIENQPTRIFMTQRETIAVMIGIAMMSGMREPLMPMTPRQRPMY